jgi:hypothetical protein
LRDRHYPIAQKASPARKHDVQRFCRSHFAPAFIRTPNSYAIDMPALSQALRDLHVRLPFDARRRSIE